jgi:hypothetical protein
MNFKSYSIILLLFSISCAPQIDKNKFENVNRAAKTIEGSVKIGVNYQRFSELLQNMSTEATIVKDQIKTEEEAELLKRYEIILETYQESGIVWQNMRYGYIYVEGEIEAIVVKYNLPTETHKFPRKFRTISGNVIQLIWETARIKTDSANVILNK